MAYYEARETLDAAQELARSSFADMLLDDDRNKKFKSALEKVIAENHENGNPANVVDIGTGCGLLSLYAAEAGADSITALEVFRPVAEIAQRVFQRSPYADRIKLVTTRSTDLKNAPTTSKGNILVAEVFDTELIGEGALRTFKEAFKTLIEPGSRVIPSRAQIWALPVQSDELAKFKQAPSKFIHRPENIKKCPGSASIFDIQLSELEPGRDFQPLSQEPLLVFSFDFDAPDSIEYRQSRQLTFRLVDDSDLHRLDAILVWWNLDMTGDGSSLISTAPKWICAKNGTEYAWRDHWIQGVCFLPQTLTIPPYSTIRLLAFHDEFSFWFDAEIEQQIDSTEEPKPTSTSSLEGQNGAKPINNFEPPVCTCRMHVVCPRTSLYRMNDFESGHGKEYLQELIQTSLNFNSGAIVCVNEGSMIGLYLAEMALQNKKVAMSVHVVEPNNHFRQILRQYVKANEIEEKCQFYNNINELPKDLQIAVIIFEPFYLSCASLPEILFKMIEDINSIRRHYPDQPDIAFFPEKYSLFAMPVHFDNLWKICAPAGIVDGHDLTPFDEANKEAREMADANIESHSLWEYPSTNTGSIVRISADDFKRLDEGKLKAATNITLSTEKSCTNAIVFWTEFGFGTSCNFSNGLLNYASVTGPTQSPNEWHRGYRQSVHFLPDGPYRKALSNIRVEIEANLNLQGGIPEVEFHFEYN